MFITPYLGSEQLPRIVQDALSVAKTSQTCDMLLLSLATQLSYALPRMRTYHGVPRHEYGPEQMLMVLAAAVSGKNVITRPRCLLRAIEGKQGDKVACSIGLSVRTTERWMNHWVKNANIRRIGHGRYQKQ